MKQPRVALAAILMVLVWQTTSSAQRARFVRAEAFDSGCLKSGQFVEVTYFATDGKQSQVKGYVKAIGRTSFTVSGTVDPVEIRFKSIEILVIGRQKPEIILLKHKPVAREDDRARKAPKRAPIPTILTYG